MGGCIEKMNGQSHFSQVNADMHKSTDSFSFRDILDGREQYAAECPVTVIVFSPSNCCLMLLVYHRWQPPARCDLKQYLCIQKSNSLETLTLQRPSRNTGADLDRAYSHFGLESG